MNHHHTVPFHLLRDVPELAVGEPGAGNLIVQGDNLVALKALLPYYAGQVKCIYIDPPYNTGNEGWVYNDNVNSPLIREWLGKVVGKEAEDLSRHDKWLCMMYPRLALLRQFLREDGVIFISLDDNEASSVRFVLNEIFGKENFIATFVWQKRASPDNDETFATPIHDYIVSFAKRKETCVFNRLPRTDEADARYENPDNDPRGPWTSSDLTRREYRAHDFYPIKLPSGREVQPAAGRSWSIPKENFDALVKENRIWFGARGDSMPRRKRFLSEVSRGIVPTTWWPKDMFGDNQAAKRELRMLFPAVADIFATPKPVELLQRIFQIATNPDDLILDSFAGSGTTGHAVLQLNAQSSLVGTGSTPSQTSSAPSGTGWNPSLPRRFILVEMEPKIARDITAERVKRVALGYTNAKGEKVEGLGGGFRFCELGEPLFDQHGQIRASVTFAALARHVYFTETGEPLPGPVAADVSRLTSKPDAKGSESQLTLAATKRESPFLGVYRGVGIYLLFNGILADKSANGGNILTRAVLAKLPKFDGPKVIYAAGCLLGRERLQAERITFRQTPYAIKVA